MMMRVLAVAAAVGRLSYDFLPIEALPVALIVGVVLGFFWPRPLWTMCGLLIYLATPFPMPTIALYGIAVGILGWLPRLDVLKQRADYLLVMATFIVLLLTLAPGLLPADAGEFQLVAAEWGIAHPPGYAFYTVLAGSVAHVLPMGEMAWRVNVLSALTGAATIGLVAFTVRRETDSVSAGWIAGITLLTALTFWMTSTQASIRPLTVFFMAAMLEATLAYRRSGSRAALIRFGLAAGWGVAHHGSLFFVGLVLAGGIGFRRPWWVAIGAALTGLIPWLYLLLRADGLLAPSDLDTWDGFWNFVLARGFANDMFAFAAPEFWAERWQIMQEVFALQWSGGVMWIALAGMLWALRQDRWLGLLLMAAFLTHSFVAGTYRAPQTVEYALPAYVVIAVAVGWLAQQQRWIAALAAISLILSFQTGWQTLTRFAAQEEARNVAENTLDTSETLILSNWHRVTPLWYLQSVDGQHPQVDVQYVFPQGAQSPQETWQSRITDSLAEQPSLTVTQNFPTEYALLPYVFHSQQFHSEPSPVSDIDPIADFGDVALLNVETPDAPLQAGRHHRLVLNWRVMNTDAVTFIHLGAADAPPYAGMDIPVQVPQTPGEIDIIYDLFVPSTTPPGTWTLWAGTYDSARQPIGAVSITPAEFPIATQHPLYREIGAARLLGWDNHGGTLYLHWHLRAAEHNYALILADVEGGLWAGEQVATPDQTGYWTSVHKLPVDIIEGGVEVRMDGDSVQLPGMDAENRYVIFDDVAALIDWDVEVDDDELITELTFLPFGASYSDMQMQFSLTTSTGIDRHDFTPVLGSIPSLKWGYGRPVTSRQRIAFAGELQQVDFLFYDGFTGRVLGEQQLYGNE